MKLPYLLLAYSLGLSGCTEEVPSNVKTDSNSKINNRLPQSKQGASLKADASKEMGAPNAERIKYLEARIATIGAAFHLHTPEELAEILNDAEFLSGSGGMIDHYASFLAETTDLNLLIAALAPLKSASWKPSFLEKVFSKSPLTTPDNIKELSKLCKNSKESEKLGSAAASKVLKVPPQERLGLAQAFLDASDSDEFSRQVVGVSVAALDSLNPDTLQSWLLGLPPEISAAGDAALLRNFAKTEPNAGVEFLQRIIDTGSEPRSQAAVKSFGSDYAFSDPRGAIQWALQLPENYSHPRLQTLVFSFSSLAKMDAREAAAVLQQIKNPAEFKRLESILASITKE